MKQIQNIDLTRLRIDELLGFLVLVTQKTPYILLETDQPAITVFNASVDALDKELKHDAKNSFTQSRQEADRVADDTWRGLKMQADAMTRFPNPEVQAIAVKVDEVIERYGTLTEMGYDEEYANMKGVLEELKAFSPEDLEKIGLSVWVAALEAAYNDFILASLNKETEAGDKVKGIVQQRRREAEQAYYSLVQRINAGAIYNGDEPYLEFMKMLNAQIDERKATLAARQTRAAKKAEDEEKPAPDPDLPVDPDLPAETI